MTKSIVVPPLYHTNTSNKITAAKKHRKEAIRSYLVSLLDDLQHVEQSPRYHPEGDALYHSIQVYQCAQRDTNDPELLAAALFHDVGKAIDYPRHDDVGADALDGLLSSRIVWLIRHHLDLLQAPKKTRQWLAGSQQLNDLEKLRRWDLAGRKVNVSVISAQQAVTTLFTDFSIILHHP